ncbi:hypothetical protein Bca101_060973 [Brassica carinata]
MNMSSDETVEPGSNPERLGEPDCSYYIRTGLCRFGSTCRFNHPPRRVQVKATARMRGEYPERGLVSLNARIIDYEHFLNLWYQHESSSFAN